MLDEESIEPDRSLVERFPAVESPLELSGLQDDSKAEKNATVGWDDPENSHNPRNWPVWKKIFHTSIPALLSFALALGTSTYVAAVPYVMVQFGIGRTVALLPVSFYTIGFTVGPLLAAPISELYGRRVIYWTNPLLLVIFNAIAAASNNLAVLIIFRFFAGVGGSGILAVGAGTVIDIWDPSSAGRAAVTYILAIFLGPALGPLVGAYIVEDQGQDWKYSIWIIIFICAPVIVATLFMKETSKSRLLYLQAKKSGNKAIDGQRKVSVTKKLGVAVLRPMHMCVSEPLASLLSLYTGFNFAMIFSFFGSYNYVYLTVYGFNRKEVGLTFIAIVVGFVFGLATHSFFDATHYRKEMVRTNGKVAPEHRLYSAMFGSVLIPIGLFWYAWTPRESVHWIVPVLAGVPFGWGVLAVFVGSITFLVDTYTMTNAASAVAANGFLRFGLGAVFPLFTFQMYERLGIHWAGTVFACISVIMIPVPWVFFRIGKSLRERSRYDTNKY